MQSEAIAAYRDVTRRLYAAKLAKVDTYDLEAEQIAACGVLMQWMSPGDIVALNIEIVNQCDPERGASDAS